MTNSMQALAEHGRGAIGRKPGRITPSMLAHIVFRTAQYRKMIDWHRTVLNAEIAFSNDYITFLTYDEEHHRVAIARMPLLGRRNKARAGVDHIAFTYASLGDLLGNYDRLKAVGIEPIWCVNHGPTTSMYYEDPDGNVLELQVDNFDSLGDLETWFLQSDFDVNPIGVDFDPAELKRRHDNGTPEKQLKLRPKIGPRGPGTVPKAYTGAFIGTLARFAPAPRKA